MHLRGEGTDFDPVQAWAWLELSAERGYPSMVEAANELFDLLDEEQRRQARRLLDQELMPEYGDAVAVPRAQVEMDRRRRQSTGSRVGGRAMLGMLRVIDVQGDGLSRRSVTSITILKNGTCNVSSSTRPGKCRILDGVGSRSADTEVVERDEHDQ